MKIKNLILRVSLSVLIVISIILSGLIWTNNARFQRNTTDVTPQQTQLDTKNLAAVYLPTQIMATTKQGQKNLIYNKKENLIDTLRSDVKKWRFGRPTTVKLTAKQYLKLINRGNMLSINYPSNVSYSIFGQTFGQKVSQQDRNKNFNRLLIPLGKKGVVYLLSDRQTHGYRVKVSKQNLAVLKKAINKATVKMPINEQLMNKRPQIFYEQSVQVAQYSYLLNKQNPTDFVTALLDGKSPNSVDSKEVGDSTIYNDGTYKSLQVNHKNGTINFEDYSTSNTAKNTTSILTDSFRELSNLGNTPVNMRYFYYNPQDRTVVYRSYVEGFPVFNQTNFGTVKVQLMATGNKLDFSVYSLQVPLPSDKQAVTLPTTQNMLDQLQNAGYNLTDVKTVQLGYHWQVNHSSDSVIDLTPTYYINYNGSWLSLSQMLNTDQNEDSSSEEAN
ncbi:regulator [Loigolactobacillus backii]|uniref:YycH family regulatory protein n=1 Tax=Loigolactobacillus backii TaxID=375175 RepID=UPI0007F14930|nr:two-component system activity regulator YycH [Loigolactobacillus backii]ANK60584.1 regulator [Loigolactobacillus backii]ANK65537.1 regulator [Loigolactobacillus backii]ANK68008.1 regulator [Loigolactobacillus backii]OLF68211.1 regulator [Loigolactobacillus backii]PIO86771.1 regulator [Loigolactobacillus backii]